MARTGGEGELPSVAELVDLSQTRPLVIRGELDAKLAEEPEPAPDPLAVLDAELAAEEPEAPEERPRESPPGDRTRRAKPYVLVAGAAVALGLAAVVLVQPQQVGGKAVPPPGAYISTAPPPAPSETVEKMSESTAPPPPLTAKVHDSPVETTHVPAGAGRKPARADTPTTTPSSVSPEDQWREYVSSVISSWQQHGPGGRNR